jgi:biopolymer transport protein ExbD
MNHPAQPSGLPADSRSEVRPRRKRAGAGPLSMRINFTSMIDVVFLLLVYFVVTANFATDEGVLSAKLPASPGLSRASVGPPKRPLRIVVSSAGRHGYRIRIDGIGTAPGDFAQLAQSLTELQYDPERGLRGPYKDDHPVIIEPDGAVRWQHVVNAFNAAIKARYRNVSFARVAAESPR